jgi:hypothetical protein
MGGNDNNGLRSRDVGCDVPEARGEFIFLNDIHGGTMADKQNGHYVFHRFISGKNAFFQGLILTRMEG